ncbi:MAG TPA: ABC transporter substrate-binding protein [Burkholderiaceae bacterium]
MPLKLRCRVAVALALLVSAFAMTIGPTRAADSPRLDFAGSVTWLGQVPILVAIEKGFFKEQGIDVQVQVILNSADRVRAIAAGSAAFSNLGRTAIISEMARGDDSFVFFGNVDDSPGQEGCWARPGIQTLKDLRGKGVAANGSSEVTLMGLLAEQGMTLADLDYRSLQGTEMAPALAHGDIQAACVWQPLLARLQQAVPDGKMLGLDKDTAIFKKFGTMASPDVLIISRKLVQTQPAQARAIAVGTLKGADYTIAHLEEAAAAVAGYFHQTQEQMLPQIRGFSYFGTAGWPAHMQTHQAQMQYLAQLLFDAKRIPSLPQTARWADTSFIPKPR